MRSIRLLRALGLVAAFALSRDAASQSYSDPGFGFGARVGLSDGRSSEALTLTGGLHLRYRLTGSLGLEGGIGYRQETVADGAGPLLDLVEIPITGTGQLFFFPRGAVQPFLLAGAGLHVVKTTPAGRNATVGKVTEALFAIHVGAGLDVRPSRTSAVHLDGRWTFLEPTGIADLGAAGYDVRSGYLTVLLGVTFFR